MKVLWGIVVLVLVAAGYMWWAGMGPFSQSSAPLEQTTTETGSSPSEVAADHTVDVKDFAFGPATLTVKVGETVVWKNSDAAGHSATADDGSFDTGVFGQGESSDPVTFTTAGTFGYFCTPHPNIKGTIVVTQ